MSLCNFSFVDWSLFLDEIDVTICLRVVFKIGYFFLFIQEIVNGCLFFFIFKSDDWVMYVNNYYFI